MAAQRAISCMSDIESSSISYTKTMAQNFSQSSTGLTDYRAQKSFFQKIFVFSMHVSSLCCLICSNLSCQRQLVPVLLGAGLNITQSLRALGIEKRHACAERMSLHPQKGHLFLCKKSYCQRTKFRYRGKKKAAFFFSKKQFKKLLKVTLPRFQ